MIRDLEFREPIQVSILSERRVYRPYGMKRGRPGSKGLNLWVRSEDDDMGDITDERRMGKRRRTINLGGKNTFKVNAGDRVIICTPGGGGWGAPAGDENKGNDEDDEDNLDKDEAVTRFLMSTTKRVA